MILGDEMLFDQVPSIHRLAGLAPSVAERKHRGQV